MLRFSRPRSYGLRSVTRARALAARCWPPTSTGRFLQHPDPAIGDCRSRPYTEHRAFLLEPLTDVEAPIHASLVGNALRRLHQGDMTKPFPGGGRAS